MKKIMKKRYLILGIILLLILSLTIFLVKYRKSKLETAKMEITTNSILPTIKQEIVNDEIIPNIIDTNVASKQSDTLENITQEIVKETTKEVLTEVKQQEKSKESKQQKTQETVLQKNEAKPIEITVSSTNDETSKVEISTPVETEPEPKPKQEQPEEIVTPPTENAPNKTISNPSTPEDTIKRISADDLAAETEIFLQDIQSIKPGLTYKNVKRGQVFWPYRTSEIEIAVGGVSFGIVYYYVDTFIEDNQEKFKYYIDWAGNE